MASFLPILEHVPRAVLTLLLAIALLLAASQSGAAQELEPGSYQNAPTGVNVAAASVVISRGNVLTEASLPIEGARAEVEVLGLAYVRTLGVLGRAAKFDAQVPVTWANFSGIVAGEPRTRAPRGLADPRFRLSVNLLGSPALTIPEFAKYRQRAIVGLSLQVVPPLGQYDDDRYVNLGSNRWSFRPETGFSWGHGRVILEAAAGAWLFTHNGNYVGRTQAQSALYFAKGNAIVTFRRGIWGAVSYGRATGGRTQVDGIETNSLQTNDRLGTTWLIPITRWVAIRAVYTSGLATRFGADFDSFAIGAQYTWFKRPQPIPAKNSRRPAAARRSVGPTDHPW
ncbi:MAG TPA: transporter [Vicinamibacterales bacterium]|jgi:outer membrane putative beta-barrel porin/alpha-amylase|nr:transporter [Vicinamibacterales bacterium]